jgi:hypothetical protein
VRQDLLIVEFLEEMEQRAVDVFGGKLHQAFVDWYIEAEFGRVDWAFTDDVSDGGIDAIVHLPDECPSSVVIQAKFSKRVCSKQLGEGAYREFERVAGLFYRCDRDEFDKWLSTVRDDLRFKYRKLWTILSEENWLRSRRGFRLITTSNRRARSEFDRLPGGAYWYGDDLLELYAQYRRGRTPRAKPLVLTVDQSVRYRDGTRSADAYLFNARVAEFRKYLDETKTDVARLVARNIRYNLGGSVGRSIRSTYEKNPTDFWYLHNGLTIVCDRLISGRDRKVQLENPSVVNGAQTLYAIGSSTQNHSAARVTTRVIVRGRRRDVPAEDDHWLQTVIRGVNTQNRVRAFDFFSNEPEQIELQHRFREMKVYYERKRGEWTECRNEPRFRGFDRLSLQRLGMILTAVSSDDGTGVLKVKRGMERVFSGPDYRELFPSKSKVGFRFKRIYLAYRLYRILWDHGYQSAKTARKQRHAFWNALWLLWMGVVSADGVPSRCTLSSIRIAFDDFESRGQLGRHARKVLHDLTREVWRAWRSGRRRDPVHWTPNNFFKERYGIRVLQRYAWPKLKKSLRGLGAELIA